MIDGLLERLLLDRTLDTPGLHVTAIAKSQGAIIQLMVCKVSARIGVTARRPSVTMSDKCAYLPDLRPVMEQAGRNRCPANLLPSRDLDASPGNVGAARPSVAMLYTCRGSGANGHLGERCGLAGPGASVPRCWCRDRRGQDGSAIGCLPATAGAPRQKRTDGQKCGDVVRRGNVAS